MQAIHNTIDQVFARFIAQLPVALRDTARELPHRLGLTSDAESTWGEALENAEIFALPFMLFEDRALDSDALQSLVIEAHFFAMITALGLEMISRAEIDDAETLEVIEWTTLARDQAFAPLIEISPEFPISYQWAARATLSALIHEQTPTTEPISLAAYQSKSRQKHLLALPALMLMAYIERWSATDTHHLKLMVDGLMLGLRHRRDAVRWSEDLARGVSWPLARLSVRASSPLEAAELLNREGTLIEFLHLSGDAFRRAATAARSLGVPTIAAWALEQADRSNQLAKAEALAQTTVSGAYFRLRDVA